MRFFSKVVFICNLCFIGAVILRYVEIGNKKNETNANAIPFQPLESTLVVLGYSAIFLNLLFLVIVLMQTIFKKPSTIPIWLLVSNLIVFIAQLIYFLF